MSVELLGFDLTPEGCYRIYLSNKSEVERKIKLGVQPQPVTFGFRKGNETVDPLDAYYASQSLSDDEKIQTMIDLCMDKTDYIEAGIIKFISDRYNEYDFEKALQFEFDFGKSLANYISFIEHQYSILMDLDDDALAHLTMLMTLIENEILVVADEEGMGGQPAGKFILKYENKMMKIVCLGER